MLKKIKSNKASGPDGFNSGFFIKCWDIVGELFCQDMKSFFDTSNLHRNINSTLIALIPKTRMPSTMNEFRPISLCTTVYKCITKILAARLQVVLPHIVDKEHSTFIHIRQISYNFLLAQESFRGYRRASRNAKYALKVDMHKAFNSIDWEFLLDSIKHIGFPDRFIR